MPAHPRALRPLSQYDGLEEGVQRRVVPVLFRRQRVLQHLLGCPQRLRGPGTLPGCWGQRRAGRGPHSEHTGREGGREGPALQDAMPAARAPSTHASPPQQKAWQAVARAGAAAWRMQLSAWPRACGCMWQAVGLTVKCGCRRRGRRRGRLCGAAAAHLWVHRALRYQWIAGHRLHVHAPHHAKLQPGGRGGTGLLAGRAECAPQGGPASV